MESSALYTDRCFVLSMTALLVPIQHEMVPKCSEKCNQKYRYFSTRPSERLMPPGIMRSQLKARLKLMAIPKRLGTISWWCTRGFRSLQWTPWCRDSPAFRTTVVSIVATIPENWLINKTYTEKFYLNPVKSESFSSFKSCQSLPVWFGAKRNSQISAQIIHWKV